MDSVLDFLFLRRLQLNYISPPICPIPVASATGLSIPVQSICPLTCPDAPALDAGFLVWGIEPLPANCCTNVVCFNLYQQIGSSFVPVSECQQPNTLVVCSAASWTVSAIFSTGTETSPTGPFISDGIHPLTIPLPFSEGVVSYRVTKNGATVLLTFMSAGFEICNPPACYSLSQITSDGETCLSPVTCMSAPPPPPPVDSLHDVAAYWKFDDNTGANTGIWLDSVSSNNLVDYSAAINPTVFSTAGRIDTAAKMTDVELLQGIQAPDSTVLGAGPGVSFSFSLWVNAYIGSNLSGGRPIFAKMDTGVGALGEYRLQHDNGAGNLTFEVRRGDNTVNVSINALSPPDGFFPPDGQWHHIACGYDDTLQEIWIIIDNVQRYSTPCVGVHRDPTRAFNVFNFSDHAFRGTFTIDEMGLWKRPLTAAEITRLYNGGAGYALSNFYP